MNVTRYLLDLAYNSILQNGDYSDELYWFEKGSDADWYFDLMNWDMARIQLPCHRSHYFTDPLTFCAQSVIDYVLLSHEPTRSQFRHLLHDILRNDAAVAVLEKCVEKVLSEFIRAAGATADTDSVLTVTFLPGMDLNAVKASATKIISAARKRSEELLSLLAECELWACNINGSHMSE